MTDFLGISELSDVKNRTNISARSGLVPFSNSNSAVSISEAILGRLSWKNCLIYISGQFTGAFISSAVVYLVYYDVIDYVDPARTVPGMDCFEPNCTDAVFYGPTDFCTKSGFKCGINF